MPAPKGNKYALGNKGGGKKKYSPEIIDKMIEFFSRPLFREEVVEREIKEGKVYREVRKKVGNNIPFFAEFAREIGVYPDTLNKWAKTHKEFKLAYKMCQQLQKEFLIHNAIQGFYNATFAIFTAKNITDMKDDNGLRLMGDKRNPVVVKNIDKLNEKKLDEFLQKKLGK